MSFYNPYMKGPDIGGGIQDFMSLYMMFKTIEKMYPKEMKELEKAMPEGQPQGPIGGLMGMQQGMPPQGPSSQGPPPQGIGQIPTPQQGTPPQDASQQHQLLMMLQQMLGSMPRQ